MTFEEFPKIPRLNREIVITEKIDGTNAAVVIIDKHEDPVFPTGFGPSAVVGDWLIFAQSRTRLVTPEKGKDNHGFAAWVSDNADELVQLGPGRHFGEWWGKGIQRGYGLDHKRFSLFNVGRWYPTQYGTSLAGPPDGLDPAPACCHVVPVLYRGLFNGPQIEWEVQKLRIHGSVTAPGFMDPEGVIVYHTAANRMFKVTCKDDEKPKEQVNHESQTVVKRRFARATGSL